MHIDHLITSHAVPVGHAQLPYDAFHTLKSSNEFQSPQKPHQRSNYIKNQLTKPIPPNLFRISFVQAFKQYLKALP